MNVHGADSKHEFTTSRVHLIEIIISTYTLLNGVAISIIKDNLCDEIKYSTDEIHWQ